MIEREAVAKEMFPYEYALIDDDHMMPTDLQAKVTKEINRRIMVRSRFKSLLIQMPAWVSVKAERLFEEIQERPWEQ